MSTPNGGCRPGKQRFRLLPGQEKDSVGSISGSMTEPSDLVGGIDSGGDGSCFWQWEILINTEDGQEGFSGVGKQEVGKRLHTQVFGK